MDAKLILLADDGRPGEYKLKLPVIMGRSRQAGLTVLHSSVSRQHCELSEYEGQLVVNDLGSLNGTFIEETRIAEPTILPDGGLLRVGSVRFQAAYGAGDLAPPPVPAPGAARTAVAGSVSPSAAEADETVGPPETKPLEPAGPATEEELELTLDEDSQAAAPEAGDEAFEFMPWDEPPGPPAAPPPAPPAPPAAKKPASPAAAPRRAPSPAPPPAPTKTPAPQQPATSDEQTLSFIPGVPESQPKDEALAEDLDSFFKSLQ